MESGEKRRMKEGMEEEERKEWEERGKRRGVKE